MEKRETSPQLEAKYNMINVGEKEPTSRTAVATGLIEVGERAFGMIRDRKIPKGDPLVLAEVAGIQAAKRASENIPLCHPLSLDHIGVQTELVREKAAVRVRCVAKAYAKTGVEMEALAGVQGALLAIYDLVKAVEPALKMGEIFLEKKEGGKHGVWNHPGASQPLRPPSATLDGIRVSVLTISDRVSSGDAENRSGPVLALRLEEAGADVHFQEVVPDEVDAIRKKFEVMVEGSQVVLTTGGTGASARDVTPEALRPLLSKEIPGIGELLRKSGEIHTPMSYLSRSFGGLIGSTLVVSLPGSPKAVEQGLEVLTPLLPHLLHVSKGGGHG